MKEDLLFYETVKDRWKEPASSQIWENIVVHTGLSALQPAVSTSRQKLMPPSLFLEMGSFFWGN
jgi:hypothetical protein